jgi:hypothetical protein
MADYEEEPAVLKNAVDIEETSDIKEVKLFGRWTFDDVNVSDISLVVSIVQF